MQQQAFIIANQNSGKVLDVPSGSPDDGIPIQQYTLNGDNGSPNQLWNLVRYSNQPFFQIISVATGKALTVLGASLEDLAQVYQFPPADNPAQAGQAWKFVYTGFDGFLGVNFKIVAVHSGKVLDVRGSSTADGAVIQQFHDHRGAGQIWEPY